MPHITYAPTRVTRFPIAAVYPAASETLAPTLIGLLAVTGPCRWPARGIRREERLR